MSENANSGPNSRRSDPKFFLENQESYIPAAVQRAISQIKTIQSSNDGGNELKKIEAIRAILEEPKVKEYFASLREKRALLLREFNLLNGANGGNINVNVRARGDRLNAFIHILDTMKDEMNTSRNKVNGEKKKRFLRDLKILSTIHGNLQKELYPVLMAKKGTPQRPSGSSSNEPRSPLTIRRRTRPVAPAPVAEPADPAATASNANTTHPATSALPPVAPTAPPNANAAAASKPVDAAVAPAASPAPVAASNANAASEFVNNGVRRAKAYNYIVTPSAAAPVNSRPPPPSIYLSYSSPPPPPPPAAAASGAGTGSPAPEAPESRMENLNGGSKRKISSKRKSQKKR